MSFSPKFPLSWNDKATRKVEIDLSSPGLAVVELERLLFTGKAIVNHADEVWPRLYIGDQHSAMNVPQLASHGVTHVLNANHRKQQDGAKVYQGTNIRYLGIEARDSSDFDMSPNFLTAAEFVHRALSGGGVVLVHCAVGVSRSATLVLAYLMLRRNLTLVESICAVKDSRGIIPNRGFLRQLINLETKLRGRPRNTHT